jgi:hypothetical protein
MGGGPAEFLGRHLLMGHGLDHVGSGDEHVGRAVHHADEIRDGRRIDGAARARAHDGRELRDHAAGARVAVEDVGVTGQRLDALLDPGSARIVEPDDRRAGLHGQVHDAADLLGVGLRQAAAEDGEVLAEHVDQPALDGAVSGHHTVPVGPVVHHAEVVVAVPDQGADFLEGAFVEQEVEAFAGGELALGVLRLDASWTAAQLGLGAPGVEVGQAIGGSRDGGPVGGGCVGSHGEGELGWGILRPGCRSSSADRPGSASGPRRSYAAPARGPKGPG